MGFPFSDIFFFARALPAPRERLRFRRHLTEQPLTHSTNEGLDEGAGHGVE